MSLNAIKKQGKQKLAKSQSDKKGFSLPKTKQRVFHEQAPFYRELQAQAESVLNIPVADILKRVEPNGKLAGTDCYLTDQSFNELCKIIGTPATFIQRLAQADIDQACDVIETMAGKWRNKPAAVNFLVDDRDNLIHRIVGPDYGNVPAQYIYDAMKASAPNLEFTTGVVQGLASKFSFCDQHNVIEPKKGDVVSTGVSVESLIGDELQSAVSTYLERLVCTNGMTSRDAAETYFVNGKDSNGEDDSRWKAEEAAVMCTTEAYNQQPRLEQASNTYLDSKLVQDTAEYLRKQGGKKLAREAFERAKVEAKHDSRSEDVLSLWDVANGVTEQIHDASSLLNRSKTEHLGYAMLRDFTDPTRN